MTFMIVLPRFKDRPLAARNDATMTPFARKLKKRNDLSIFFDGIIGKETLDLRKYRLGADDPPVAGEPLAQKPHAPAEAA